MVFDLFFYCVRGNNAIKSLSSFGLCVYSLFSYYYGFWKCTSSKERSRCQRRLKLFLVRYNLRCCGGTGRLPQHAPHAVSAPSTLAGPCTTHGRWSHSQGCPVRRACLGAPSSRSPCAALQGRLQARPQSYRHRHWQLGIACRGSRPLASSCAFRSQEGRGEEKQTAGRDKSKKKTETDSQPGNAIHLQQLRQRLSRQDWVAEPLQTLLRTRLRTNQGAHHCLSRQTDAY